MMAAPPALMAHLQLPTSPGSYLLLAELPAAVHLKQLRRTPLPFQSSGDFFGSMTEQQ
jgi:hypothetical protein